MSASLPDAVWVDGRPAGEVSVLERGLHYGDGLFETIACVGGRPRLLPRHLKRLVAGCARLQLPQPDLALLAGEISGAAGTGAAAVVKLILARGPAAARGYAFPLNQAPTRILLRYPAAAAELATAPPAVAVRLGQLRLAENPALAGIKHLNRLEQVLARAEWSDPAIAESLHFSVGGALVCGTACNVFLVRAGVLMTPRLELCGVAGVMREVVAELAEASGLHFEKRLLTCADLDRAEEIFLTNALTGIRAVAQLAGRPLGAGPVTHHLQQALARYLAAEAGA